MAFTLERKNGIVITYYYGNKLKISVTLPNSRNIVTEKNFCEQRTALILFKRVSLLEEATNKYELITQLYD